MVKKEKAGWWEYKYSIKRKTLRKSREEKVQTIKYIEGRDEKWNRKTLESREPEEKVNVLTRNRNN